MEAPQFLCSAGWQRENEGNEDDEDDFEALMELEREMEAKQTV